MLYIPDLKEGYDKYGLPFEFAECLPDHCSTCGAVLAMRESLTQLHCENPRCPDKLTMRIKAICQSLNILNFGEKTIEKFLEYYDVSTPLQIFALTKGMIVSPEVSMAVSEDIISQIEKKKDFLLWEYVQIANIPGVQTCAKDIFGEYNTISDAYKDIEAGGVSFIQSKLGINCDGEVSIRAMKIYEALMIYKADLLECEEDVHIIKLEGKKELSIYCSDYPGAPFKNKPAFYAQLKSQFADRYHFNILSGVRKSMDYLVWGGVGDPNAIPRGKVLDVQRYNEKGANIPIVTGEQLIEILNKQ